LDTRTELRRGFEADAGTPYSCGGAFQPRFYSFNGAGFADPATHNLTAFLEADQTVPTVVVPVVAGDDWQDVSVLTYLMLSG